MTQLTAVYAARPHLYFELEMFSSIRWNSLEAGGGFEACNRRLIYQHYVRLLFSDVAVLACPISELLL